MKVKALLLLLSAILWAGCSSPIEVVLTGAANMNNGGYSTQVKIYELSGDSNFLNTPLSAFWPNDEEALGDEMVAPPQRRTLDPEDTVAIEFELTDETAFVGVAADLRNPVEGQWRQIFPADEVGDRMSITVQNDRISVEVEGGGLPILSQAVR